MSMKRPCLSSMYVGSAVLMFALFTLVSAPLIPGGTSPKPPSLFERPVQYFCFSAGHRGVCSGFLSCRQNSRSTNSRAGILFCAQFGRKQFNSCTAVANRYLMSLPSTPRQPRQGGAVFCPSPNSSEDQSCRLFVASLSPMSHLSLFSISLYLSLSLSHTRIETTTQRHTHYCQVHEPIHIATFYWKNAPHGNSCCCSFKIYTRERRESFSYPDSLLVRTSCW